MKLWKILLATMIALVLVCAVAMAQETDVPEPHVHQWYNISKETNVPTGKSVDAGDGENHFTPYMTHQGCLVKGCVATQLVEAYWKEGHNGVTTTPATCTDKPTETINCTLCGLKKGPYATGNAAGHKFTISQAVLSMPTCQEQGYKANKCSVCGEFDLTSKTAFGAPDPKAHAWDKGTEIKAECEVTTAGIKYVCTVENCSATWTESGAACEQELGWDVTKEMTCTEAGSRNRVCLTCGHIFWTEEIPVKHEIEKVAEKYSTCKDQGWDAYAYCEICGKIWNYACNEELDAIPYRPVNETAHEILENGWNYEYNYSCTSTLNYKWANCIICGAYLEEKLPAGNHEWADVAELAGKAAGTQINGVGVVTKASNCTETGEGYVVCAKCHDQKHTTAIPATGHRWTEWKYYSAATCTEPMKAYRICGNNNNHVEYKEIAPANGHNWVMDEATYKAPACEVPGKADYKCTGCSLVKHDVEIPALEHVYEEKVTEATCTKAGKVVYTCTLCGDKYSEKIPATGHLVTEEVVVTPATCTEKGSANIVCVACKEVVDTKVLPALGHGATKEDITLAPTCTEKGSKNIICTVCNEVIETKEIAALGHGETKVVVTKEATCTEKGSKNTVCTVCDAVLKTEEIAALGHDVTKVVEVVAPTCTEAGYTVYTCTRGCDVTKEADVVDALGHEYTWIVAVKPSESGNGRNEYKCDECGDVAAVKTVRFSKYYYNNTMTSFGPTTKELVGGNDWYRVTPVDVTVDGVYTYDLIASNRYVVGTVTITVNAGVLTVSYDVASGHIDVKDEALLIYASKADLAEGKAVTANVGAAINVAETFGSDAKVIVSLVLTGDYDAFGHNVVPMVIDDAEIANMIANID